MSTLSDGGRTGTLERWEDVSTGRFAERENLPPTAGGLGFDGISPWVISRNGIAYRLGDWDGQQSAADEAYRVARGWWFDDRHQAAVEDGGIRREGGRSFDLLRITPEGGRAFVLWIDRASHLIDRTVEQQAEDLVVTKFADYRRVAGVLLPFSVRIGDGQDASYDRVQIVQHIDVNQAAPARIYDLPALPPAEITLPAGAASVQVPFRLEGNRILVPLTIGGQGPFEAEFDSGGGLIIPPALVARLTLDTGGQERGSGGGEGTISEKLGVVPRVGLGGATISHLVFNSFALSADAPERALAGIEVLQRFVVHFDFDRCVMTLTRPEDFAYHGEGAVIPFHFQDNQPEINGDVDGIAGLFTIDTGDSGSLLLLAPFARRYGLVARYHAILPYSGHAISATHGVVARVGEVNLYGADGRKAAQVSRPVTYISLQHAGFDANREVSANVGLGILKQFNLTFDYRRQVIILERNGLHGVPEVYDRVGLHLLTEAGGWRVVLVTPGTPAAEAGLREGDLIAAIDDQPPGQLSMAALHDKLRGPVGSVLILRVRNKTLRAKLRDLL